MPSDPRDYRIELSSVAPPTGAGDGSSMASPAAGGAARPFLSVNFACCSIYQRIYRSADGTHYAGRCPRCSKAVRFAVGSGGTSSRSFTVR